MSSIKALPYPAVEDGNFSFPDAVYEVAPKSPGNSENRATFRHQLKGAPFIEKLIQSGEAKFACLFSIPKTVFRELYISNSNEQEITWDLDVVGEPPILGPLVVYVGRGMRCRLTDQDGVSRIWQNREIELPQGARLARGRYFHASNTIQRLIKVRCIEGMEKGSFTVKANSNDGFYFTLESAPDIFWFLQNPQGQLALRKSILVNSVTQALNILKDNYKDPEEWERHRNLKSLSNLLEDRNMRHWSEEDFDAALVAGELYPIQVPRNGRER